MERTSVRRDTRPQVLYRQHYFHKLLYGHRYLGTHFWICLPFHVEVTMTCKAPLLHQIICPSSAIVGSVHAVRTEICRTLLCRVHRNLLYYAIMVLAQHDLFRYWKENQACKAGGRLHLDSAHRRYSLSAVVWARLASAAKHPSSLRPECVGVDRCIGSAS